MITIVVHYMSLIICSTVCPLRSDKITCKPGRRPKCARRKKKEEESCSDKMRQTETGAEIDAVELAT